MLNPETNPLYRQVLFDGEKKTNIKTIRGTTMMLLIRTQELEGLIGNKLGENN